MIILSLGLVLLGIVALFGFGITLSNNYDNWNRRSMIIVTIWGIVAIIGIYAFVSEMATTTETDKQQTTSYELVALQDTEAEDLHFQKRIFSMRIDKQDMPVYRFYYQKENGDINFCEESVENISLVYTKGTPCYEIITHSTIHNRKFLGFIPYTQEFNDDLWYEYKLHIPEGSLATDIKIDMQ